MKTKTFDLPTASTTRIAAETLATYGPDHAGGVYDVTIVDESTITVGLLDRSIGFGPADRIVKDVSGADRSAPWGEGGIA